MVVAQPVQQIQNRKRAFEASVRQNDICGDRFAERVAVVVELTESHADNLS